MRPDGIEAPIGPVLGAPRRSRDRARIAVVAAIAVVVLAAGIGLAGNGFSSPPSSAEPSASTSPSVGPTAGATPTASRFFRVINSDTAGPLPTPGTPPTVPCAAPPAGGVPPTLVLTGADGGPVEGTPDLGAPLVVPPITPVRLGDLIEIRVAGDACAIAWTIEATQPDVNSNRYEIEREPNAGNNPFLFAQNRWRLHDLPTGNLFVTATIRFSVDVLVTSRWLLDVQGGAVPVARIVAPDGSTVAALPSDCGASWTFEEGTGGYRAGGYRECQTQSIPSSLSTLRVAPETPLRVEVPGWTIVGWNGSCGRSDETNPLQSFLTVDGCDLGGRYYQTEGESAPAASSAPVPAVFLPRSTGPLVSLYLTVQRDGATVSFGVWAMIETTS